MTTNATQKADEIPEISLQKMTSQKVLVNLKDFII
jgi:hypothetical protein